ncbi:group 1 glycosyl transferase [Sphingobacteriaceae bacterium]|nr:group 1 glycosyl transferase [Sphingobacteriaceae bacterium]
MKIYAFHLLNDYSGSPKVLKQLVNIWIKNNKQVTIVTSGGRKGFLSDIKGANYSFFWYKLAPNPLIRLFNLMLSQLLLLLKLLFVVKKEDIIYVNTVLPFGAAVLGKIKGCRVIYHIHETSMKPAIFKRFLFAIVKWTASELVFVSHYLKKDLQLDTVKSRVIYNAIEDDFLEIANRRNQPKELNKNVLMICSLKEYKGVFEFVRLAQHLSDCNFRLVVNAAQQEIDNFFLNTVLPRNLEIYPTHADTHPFYRWANVILNLSKPQGWIETFGLTIIEGMAYGLPAIVPTVGGITELVSEGENGFKVNSNDLNDLCAKLKRLLEDQSLYSKMRTQALIQITKFNEQNFSEASMSLLAEEKVKVLKSEKIPVFGIKI